MDNGSTSRYNYDRPSGKDEKELIEKLDVEKIDEFKKFFADVEEKIKEKFGPSGITERLRYGKINDFVSGIQGCKVSAFLMYHDARTMDMINFKKISLTEPSGEEAIASLKMEFADRLKLPWLRRMNLFDYPFEVEYKKGDDKKLVIFTIEFRNGNFLAKYKMIIRET